MFQRLLGVLALGVILGAAGRSWAAPQPEAAKLLRQVHSASGRAVWGRIAECGIKIRRARTDHIFQDAPQAGLKQGDVSVDLLVVMPRPVSGEQSLIWTLRQGRAVAGTGWADRLQNAKAIPELRC